MGEAFTWRSRSFFGIHSIALSVSITICFMTYTSRLVYIVTRSKQGVCYVESWLAVKSNLRHRDWSGISETLCNSVASPTPPTLFYHHTSFQWSSLSWACRLLSMKDGRIDCSLLCLMEIVNGLCAGCSFGGDKGGILAAAAPRRRELSQVAIARGSFASSSVSALSLALQWAYHSLQQMRWILSAPAAVRQR